MLMSGTTLTPRHQEIWTSYQATGRLHWWTNVYPDSRDLFKLVQRLDSARTSSYFS